MVLGSCVLMASLAQAQQTPGTQATTPSAKSNFLPHADAAFKGVANRTLAGSKPDFPQPVKPPRGAPNVLLVLVDDAGFGNPSTFASWPRFVASVPLLRYDRPDGTTGWPSS